MVAKSYQKFEIAAGPYEVNGRQYVKLSNGKQVRFYTEAEYYKIYPEDKKQETVANILKPLKEVLGFDKGYITICKGNTYEHLEWFKNSDFRFSTYFGWYLCSSYELPADFPADLTPVQLLWEDVALPDGTALKTEAAVKEAVEKLVFEPSPSEFYGMIGDKVMLTLTVIKAIELDGYFGRSVLHVFEDENKNVFTWTTGARHLEEGKTYTLRGSIKDHTVYKNCQQTVLTRCFIQE